MTSDLYALMEMGSAEPSDILLCTDDKTEAFDVLRECRREQQGQVRPKSYRVFLLEEVEEDED